MRAAKPFVAESEALLKTKIIKILKKYKVFYFMPPAGVFGRAGIADFVCCINSRFVALEAKSEKGQQRPLQKLAERQIKQADGVYLLVRPSNLETLELFLNDIQK